MPTLLRYLAFQLPGWTVAGLVAWGLLRWSPLPAGLVVAGLLLYVAKDFAIYPFVRDAYEHTRHDPGGALVGREARVVVRLAPEGWVQVGSERWRARAAGAEQVFEAGTRVRVRGLHGYTLLVEAPAAPAERASRAD